ncbi:MULTISPECIES: DUF6472 family protein [Vallitalea]|uniref:DUF6472 domain-containing protein n=2 Tax=Vallitalea TaxID=1348611 RepID=A0A8J8SBK6_9FIRM|nr:DUF6472 family protein [Vallitalea guaymasensis]QUH28436.1 hypothetical protein HYG85_05665 [Vallitalea guaymasensis]GMQ63933.1 hypothetical protein AN2V17_31690 [Vallitalea sp. AN17-2]
MKKNQCDYCLYLTYDEETDDYYCSLSLEQDDVEKLSYSKYNGCPYFRMGDDYTIVRKQAF